MNKERIIFIISIIFILIWVLRIPYITHHPFQSNDFLKELAQDAVKTPEFIKKQTHIDGLTANDLEKKLMKEFTINWLISIIIIIWGCFSGYLLIRKKNYGRILAIGLSLIFIGYRLNDLISSEHWKDKISLKYLALRFEYFPLITIQEELTFIVLLVTAGFLLHPSIAKIFKHN